MQTRPVFLNLLQIYFPVTAIASILHRISGVLLFVAIPFLLWGLQLTTNSVSHFESAKECILSPFGKVFLWVIVSSMIYHIIAGSRHIIMDMGYGETKCVGKATAWIVIFLAALLITISGVSIWFL